MSIFVGKRKAMKRILTVLIIAMLGAQANAFRVVVENLSTQPRNDHPVVIDIKKFANVTTALVTCGSAEVPCQLDDLNQDGSYDELCFLADLGPKERKEYEVKLTGNGGPRLYPARVCTEMVMRNDKVKEKTKQNNYVDCPW